jgi:hypothetical protein
MGRKIIFFFTCAVALIALMGGCRKDQVTDVVPSITFEGFSKQPYANFAKDSIVFVRIGFADGDGDIGLNITDSASPFKIGEPYYYNVFAEYLAGKNGVYTHLVNGTDTVNYNDRIQNLVPDTRNKSITGTITLKIDAIVGSVIPDSIKLNIYIVDRALHHSNVISTGPIPVTF